MQVLFKYIDDYCKISLLTLDKTFFLTFTFPNLYFSKCPIKQKNPKPKLKYWPPFDFSVLQVV